MADAYVTLNEAAELEGTTYARQFLPVTIHLSTLLNRFWMKCL